MKKTIDDMKTKMEKTINVLDDEYRSLRAGRANPAILSKVTVDYYGTPTPINQVAAVNVPEARIITIQPWDKSLVKAVERAINASDIGINPQSDGQVIRLIFPPLNEERRKELSKEVKKMGESSKVAIRSIRRDAVEKLKAMKKSSEITEDDLKQSEKKVQDITDKFCSQIDEMSDNKTKELMEI